MTNDQELDYQSLWDNLNIYNVPRLANDNIFEPLNKMFEAGELTLGDINVQHTILPKVEEACQALLDALLIDTANDHNTQETAKRMAKMYVYEVFAGRYIPKPNMKEFSNAKNLDQIYTVGPATIRSGCSHHIVPIIGQVWVGVLPDKHENGGKVLGMSKFGRLAEWVFARPQIQEEATQMLCDEIWEAMQPKGLAVTVRAQHMCMTWRGVQEPNITAVTSAMRGVIKDDGNARMEYFNLIKGQGF